jgi:glutaredoxin 3
MAHVRVYTSAWCGYCNAAKRFLTQVKGVTFEEIDLSRDPAKRAWLAQATGQRTVPQIFVGDQPIGGYTDMRDLDASGRLDEMLSASDPQDGSTA